MTLIEAREHVRKFIQTWTTERLCMVLAFAEDGKMNYLQPCCCLMGCATARVLHVDDVISCPEPGHYAMAQREARRITGYGGPFSLAEAGYLYFGLYSTEGEAAQEARDRELIAILRQELGEREVNAVHEMESVEAVAR